MCERENRVTKIHIDITHTAICNMAVEHEKSKELIAAFVASLFRLHLVPQNTSHRCEPTPSGIDVRDACEICEKERMS